MLCGSFNQGGHHAALDIAGLMVRLDPLTDNLMHDQKKRPGPRKFGNFVANPAFRLGFLVYELI
jgi:hypothetical protein